jgi:hypothetical protein
VGEAQVGTGWARRERPVCTRAKRAVFSTRWPRSPSVSTQRSVPARSSVLGRRTLARSHPVKRVRRSSSARTVTSRSRTRASACAARAARVTDLSHADVRPVLAKIADLERELVLVGGQAVNFWASFYQGRAPALAREAPFTSKDIDFCGDQRSVRVCAERLGGTPRRRVERSEPPPQRRPRSQRARSARPVPRGAPCRGEHRRPPAWRPTSRVSRAHHACAEPVEFSYLRDVVSTGARGPPSRLSEVRATLARCANMAKVRSCSAIECSAATQDELASFRFPISDASVCTTGHSYGCPASRTTIEPGASCGMAIGFQCVYADSECDCIQEATTSRGGFVPAPTRAAWGAVPSRAACWAHPAPQPTQFASMISNGAYETCSSCGNRWTTEIVPNGNGTMPSTPSTM